MCIPIPLTTEEEGVALLAGADLGGARGVLLMQSSGVGNCINMLSLIAGSRFPFLTLVSMRGDYGEGNPWQYPMGQAVQPVLEAMGVICLKVEDPAEVVRCRRRGVDDGFPVRAGGRRAAGPAAHRRQEVLTAAASGASTSRKRRRSVTRLTR